MSGLATSVGELRLHEFDPRLHIYGFSRIEGLKTLLKILEDLQANEPTVGYVFQNRSMGERELCRRNIIPQGTEVPLSGPGRILEAAPPPWWMVVEERERRAGNEAS